ncbi:Mss4-like protein [Lasiosphaeris hirsuta]|uniref:Mss4-like protein n=1 Tax=Lasiosphaeris hirsuta TaxID=260670 RepID=A0AA40AGW5_9PEZI|nr:Mss4-like protein [Lasiosphaeris hirsuta]
MSEILKTYRGNCHCGAFIFEAKTHDIRSVIGCNCSNCTRKAYMWLFLPPGAVTVIKDEGLLTEFVCGPHKSMHKFCSRCGTPVLADNQAYRAGTAINARTIQNLDIWGLEVDIHNGTAIDPQWAPPVYSGPDPASGLGDSGKEYHGSCRCGAVQAAIQLPGPLDGTYKGPIIECNCSICQRGGYIWIYPKTHQLALTGADNLTGYAFSNKVWRKMFCKICGTHMMTDWNVAMTNEEFATLPAEVRAYHDPKREYRPFNVRVLIEFDPLALKTKRFDGWDELEPKYVNP